jgi:tetratricopeptide (TPR) repeat protein
LIDPNNPVVKLCAEGMRAESEGRNEAALRLFTQAWEASQDDYEACVAAHYLARQQTTPQDALRWNEEALRRAEAVSDERVEGFYPSLYLNMGYAYEVLGRRVEAMRYYEQAAARVAGLPEGPYGDLVRDGIARGLQRARGMPAEGTQA